MIGHDEPLRTAQRGKPDEAKEAVQSATETVTATTRRIGEAIDAGRRPGAPLDPGRRQLGSMQSRTGGE